MRTRCVCWGVVTLALLAGRSLAQSPANPPSYPTEMTVVVPEVEVRSGPTNQYYPTTKMRQGERVTVVGECKDQPGWAAIKPPRGSFSWIRQKLVKQTSDRSGFVQAPDNGAATVKPGSSLVEHALNVEKDKVPSGCHVTILDKPFQWQGENWLPIQPTPMEVRYIPMSALRLPPAPVQVAAGFPTSVGGLSGLPAPGSTPVSAHSNWQPVGPAPIGSTPPPPLGSGQPVAAPGGAAQTTSNRTAPWPTMTAVHPARWSEYGYLRPARFMKDGQPVYVLEDANRIPLIYAVEKPNAVPTMEKLLGRFICLYGPITYPSDVVPRIEYMVVTHWAPGR